MGSELETITKKIRLFVSLLRPKTLRRTLCPGQTKKGKVVVDDEGFYGGG